MPQKRQRGASPKIKSRIWTRLGSQNRQTTIKNRCQDAFKFCIGFRIDFWSILDLNRLQNQSKINQKILPKSTYKQVLLQLHLRSNFEDNLMFKQNGRCSKIVPKPTVFACFLDIRSCQPKQTRDMQRIEKSPKTMSKNQLFFCRNSTYFPSFLAPISKSEI